MWRWVRRCLNLQMQTPRKERQQAEEEDMMGTTGRKVTVARPKRPKRPKKTPEAPAMKAPAANAQSRSGEQEWEVKTMSELDPAAVPAITMNRDEKKAVVFVEIGDNLKETLCRAITCASENGEPIADLMEAMGVNIKAMVEFTTKLEATDRSGDYLTPPDGPAGRTQRG